MSETVEAEWTIESGEHLLRLVLFRAGDRYAHRFEARTQAGVVIQVIESVEGGDVAALSVRETPPVIESSASGSRELCEGISEVWPASPPFQQFHDQEVEGCRAWFLLGMAGKSHWSASVTALPDRSGWTFDVACRYRDIPAYLGSAYESDLSVGRIPPVYAWAITNVARWPVAYWMGDPRIEGESMPYRKRLVSSASPPASARWSYVLWFNKERA